jgi:hypothetical protein
MEKFVSDNALELTRVKTIEKDMRSLGSSIEDAIDCSFAMVAS